MNTRAARVSIATLNKTYRLLKTTLKSSIPAAALVLVLLAALPAAAQAQLVSQIESVGNACGGFYQGNDYGNCTAGEISISSVVNVQFVGNPANCVAGEALTISTATVNYSVNTNTRNDLLLWLGDQEGTDPRLDYDGVPGSTCSAFSIPNLPTGFVTPPTTADPFGDVDGDQCADIGGSPTQTSRTFTNIDVTCQDNDNDGFADLQALLTWSQNAGQACGNGGGQTFPTVGAVSKCDFGIVGNELPIVEPPILTLVKQVTNNSGGNAVASAWTLTATGPQVISGATGSPAVTDQVVQDGVYTLSETGPTGYTGTWNCTGGGVFNAQAETITLANALPAQDVTCTLTNDDNPATLTLVKSITNDNGGTSVLADWTLTATGASVTVTGLANSPNIVNQAVPAGNYTLTESGPAGYTPSAWSCPNGTLNGNVLTLALGETITCTITNNDQPANLTLTKQVVNDDGGDAVVADWTLSANATNFTSGVQQQVNAGLYTLAETGPAGYTAGAWQCTGGSFTPPDQLTLGLGETASCAIINNDVAAGLTLIKSVTNDNGGNDAAGSFVLTLAGGAYGAGQPFSDGATPAVDANVQYTVSETPNDGYTLTGITCLDDGDASDVTTTFTLAEGQSVTCTFVNDDIVPQLTLVKVVINDDSGGLAEDDFTLTLQGTDGTHDTAQNYVTGDTPAVQSNVTYTLDELAENGYANEGVTCVDDNTAAPVSHPVSLAEGQQVTCTLTNDDVAAGTITVVKEVDNDDGGTAVAADFTLYLTGDDVDCQQDGTTAYTSGTSVSTLTDGCTYTLSEDPLAGYTEEGVACVDAANGNAPVAHPVLFATGDTLVCTITNTDDGALLDLTKLVTNDNGGQAAITDWTLFANGPTPQQGDGGFAQIKVSAGEYTLSESAGPAGYTPGAWQCTGGSLEGDVLTLANGETASCSITNDDQPANLTLTKAVVNNDGGTALETEWTLNAGATAFTTGVAQDINAGLYTLSETGGPVGYTPGAAWGCTGGSFTAPDQLTLANGEVASCLITNDDIAPQLTLVKAVVNDDGAEGIPESFTLTLQGADGTHDTAQNYASGALPVVIAGVPYTLDEVLLDGYTNAGVVCLDTGNANADVGHPVTLTVGQTVTCTLTNDDVAPTLTLTKVVTNDDTGVLTPADFPLQLTGADGTHDGGVDYVSGDAPVIQSSTEYTIAEPNIPQGYRLVSVECTDTDTQEVITVPFTAGRGQNIACTVTNDDQAEVELTQFRVTKDFSDDNPVDVQVFIRCNTGLPLEQSFVISEDKLVIFVVEKFAAGEMDCDVFERPLTTGYSSVYVATAGEGGVAGAIAGDADGCHFDAVEGGLFDCAITNSLDPVDVVVTKEWLINAEDNGLPFVATASYECFNAGGQNGNGLGPIGGFLYFEGAVDTATIEGVYPDYDGSTYCTVTEVNTDSAVEPDASDCEHVPVTLGFGGSCTIYNTVFFEGIPTLNQYGLALLALLVLGVGAVGIRRLV